jgi:hypothetical protein
MNPRETTTVGAQAPSDPIVEWRRGRLLRAGFARDLATHLAEDRGTDLHALLDLVDRGCPAALAARILAPLEDSHRRC